MRITESQLRHIIAEEVQKFKKGKKINESQVSAEQLLSNAMDEYIDQMIDAQFSYEEICTMMKESVDRYCETLLESLPDEERDPSYSDGMMF